MEIFDISISITPDMPVWPGDQRVSITRMSSIENGDNANVSHLYLGAHTGTHVDAPIHFLTNGAPLEEIPLQHFIGDVQVIEILDVDLITAEVLKTRIVNVDSSRVLFKTKNSKIWEEGSDKFHRDFVALSQGAAQYLVEKHIQLVGIDYLSIAPFKNSGPTHKTLLGAGIVILEGIDLSGVEPGDYKLFCLPLKIIGVDGAPARVILIRE